MTDASTPIARKVRLKRVAALKPGDVIQPGFGTFMRNGTRLTPQANAVEKWGRGPWFVHALPSLEDWQWEVQLNDSTGPAEDTILVAYMDAYVVLA